MWPVASLVMERRKYIQRISRTGRMEVRIKNSIDSKTYRGRTAFQGWLGR